MGKISAQKQETTNREPAFVLVSTSAWLYAITQHDGNLGVRRSEAARRMLECDLHNTVFTTADLSSEKPLFQDDI